MRKYFLFLVIFCVGEMLFAQDFDTSKSFHFNHYKLKPDSEISAAKLNKQITEKDRIYVNKEGHLEADGKRIRIFGTNLTEFPTSKKQAEFAAKALANQGYNCIRFHHTDSNWTNCFIKYNADGTTSIDKARLDAFDYFFYLLKQNGIYSNINLLTGRIYNSKEGFLPEIDNISEWKAPHVLGFWDDNARKMQKKYAFDLISHVNPYTNIAYKDDPAVAIIEINNENGFLHAYLCNWLKEFNAENEYWQNLELEWNNWLEKQGKSYDSLKSNFNISEPTGKTLIDYSETSQWILENHEGAKSNVETKNGTHTIKISKNGLSSWHIQYARSKLNISSDKIYTLKFSAKASDNCEIDVAFAQAHAPWQNAGFEKKLNLEKNFTDYEFTITNLMDDENLRVIFSSMGFLSGKTIVIKNLSLTEGGKIDVIRLSKNSKKNKLVAFPKYEEYQLLPAEYQNLILNFLWEKEADYWLDMKNYITNEIGSKALIMGTSMGCSSTMLQNCFDIIDSHAYWNHPVFPKTAWDLNHYYVANKTLTKSTIDSTLATLAKYRVYGKPFSVSEYDHPYPNQFSAEMYPMIASFASFQDWDCIFTFCSTLPTNKNGQNLKITGYFDQGNNPAKSCASPIASKIFRNFLVKPAKTNYYINLDEKTERENLHKFNSWNIGNTVIYGMIPDVSLVSKIGIAVNGNVPKNAVNLLTNAPSFSSRKTFDETNQIYWDRDSGVYIVCNQDVTITVTDKNSVLPAYPEQWKKNGILQPLTNNNDFTTMMAIKENNSYILFLCSWSGNKGENLAEYGTKGSKKIYRNEINLTTSPTLGRGPAFALGGGGKLEIYNKENLKLYQVDLSGNRINQALKTGKIIQLSPYTPTLWYILEGSHWD